MTNQEILVKAFSKAAENDWSAPVAMRSDEALAKYYSEDPYEVIFSHDFAKALWGQSYENYLWVNCLLCHATPVKKPAWEMHLQQMVIAEDPIRYLAENV